MRVRVSQEALKKGKSAHNKPSPSNSRERGARSSPPKNSKQSFRDASPRTAARKAQQQHEASGGVGVVGLYDGISSGAPKRKPPPKKKPGLIAGGKKPDAALRRGSHKGLIETMSNSVR
mmetsp:Transcript_70733/g.197786  ORF Transcript_70733/g.197786 Transcript_70733/m.197786 type:complete len:119 (+) Transcript_70733:282-638(+)